jgi:hypothetical protein
MPMKAPVIKNGVALKASVGVCVVCDRMLALVSKLMCCSPEFDMV